MIQIKNVSKSYEKNKKAVSDVSINFEKGIYALLGPNGAGKTTLLKMICGILAPDEGVIEVESLNISQKPELAKSKIGFVSDSPNFFLKLKGIEFLNFIGSVYEVEKKELKERIKKYATMFSMENKLNQKIETYSNGMKQKMAIISTMVHQPKIWILDEPMTGLDPKSFFILKELMEEYASSGSCVIFSTHILDVAEKICDQMIIINKGSVVFSGSFSNFLNKRNEQKSLEEVFLELTSDE